MTTSLKAAALVVALGASLPAFAEDAHHPPEAAQTQPAPSQAPAHATRPGMGMMGPGGMMGGDMMGGAGMSGMMPMMGMMRMMQGGEHIDGRLAFIKAELKITAAQEKAWSDFATALRQAAMTVREARAGMPAISGMSGTMTPPQRLEQHEKQLAAHLDAIRTVKPALANFYAALNEEQKLPQLYPMVVGLM